MPWKPKRPCSHPGCPELTEERFCELHAKQEQKRYDKYDRDPESNKRYGRRWRKIRNRYISFLRAVFERRCSDQSRRGAPHSPSGPRRNT